MSFAASLPFNRVILTRTDGENELNLDGFFALPLQERVKAILARELRFFLGEQPVETSLALRALRTLKSVA